MWDKSTLFISSFIIEILEFLIENIDSLFFPSTKRRCHINIFDRYISSRHKKYAISKDIPKRPKEYSDKIWRITGICLSPDTSPESLCSHKDYLCIILTHSDDLICHLFPNDMFKSLDIDMP